MKKVKIISQTVVLSVILVLVTAFCISGTALSQSKNQRIIEERYYRQMERDYVREMRAFLEEKGYRDSGVTMTRVTEEDGARSYTVTIHHSGFGRLSQGEREALLEACAGIAFPVEECAFSHQFLEKY